MDFARLWLAARSLRPIELAVRYDELAYGPSLFRVLAALPVTFR